MTVEPIQQLAAALLHGLNITMPEIEVTHLRAVTDDAGDPMWEAEIVTTIGFAFVVRSDCPMAAAITAGEQTIGVVNRARVVDTRAN